MYSNMGMQRIRVDVAVPVITDVAVCFAAADDAFVLRYVVRWHDEGGIPIAAVFRTPLSLRELIAETGGSDLADWLLAHPGRWWHLPAAGTKEGDAA
jgi:hypothetical protein